MSPTIEQWLLDSVRYFRTLGFFQNQPQADEELARLEGERLEQEWDGEWNPSWEHPDLFLLAHDAQRVWWMDMEADVCRDNHVYIDTLREWGSISRGAFEPEAIREEWNSDKGPIFVTFRHKNKPSSISPKFWGDFIDTEILRELDQIIQGTGIRFEPHANFDQTCFIVALTSDEKRRLRSERGWKFQF